MTISKLVYFRLNVYISLALVLLHLVSIAQQSLSDSTIAQLRRGVEGFQQRYHAPSMVVAIVHEDSVIYFDARGYTDLENKIPATIDSRYQIQSITKMFTATMFMQLCEQGVINALDDIEKTIPEFSTGTTYLELATHNAGLPRNSPADINFARQVDRWLITKENATPIQSSESEDFIKSFSSVTKQYPAYEFLPQHSRHYSNFGYGLLGLSLERAAGEDYEDYVVSNICAPLGMKDTGFGTVYTATNPVAKGYFYQNDSVGFIRTPDYYPHSMIPAAGMYSTARDLARFISAQFDGADGVLSSKNRRMMQQLGIGWMRNYPFVLHEGSMLGARAEIIFNPELRIGWVILTNTTDFPFNRINDYIASLMVPLYTKKPVVDLEKYVGTYALDGGYGELEIYLKGGKLYSSYLTDLLPESELSLSADNSLTMKGKNGYQLRYEFVLDGKNKIKALALNQLLWIKQ